MGDPTDDSYILIEDSHNLDDGDANEKQSDVHDKSEEASQHTLNQQGVFVKPMTPITESEEPTKDLLFKKLLDQGGIEIIQDKEPGEDGDSY